MEVFVYVIGVKNINENGRNDSEKDHGVIQQFGQAHRLLREEGNTYVLVNNLRKRYWACASLKDGLILKRYSLMMILNSDIG